MTFKLDTLPQRRAGKQQGFIQAILLFGIALMAAILGGFALANRSPTSQTDTEQAKVNASVALKQGSDLQTGVLRFGNDFGSSAITNTMDFSSTTNQGLFDPAARYASPQVMPASAFASPSDPAIAAPSTYEAGHWYLNKATAANAIGTAAVDPMAVLPDLRSDVCARIDNMLYGASAIPVSTGALSDWANATTPADGGISAVAAVAGWAEGCVQTSDAKYVYFKVVQEN
ncbi:hypothetical protein [Limnobacter litoralis]|uniref:Type 4 fimbrial biogenesis protein PilX N-terminal domain-containing protein n=1 Tax=Limnobacter litoralis TaxID=481366 RepID=A0ABQ5YRS1_9BURK|nr:hypothetical protein [Limnobacter litoralis]GLR27309.1 hypothetical protein GCM10007875_24000 [Limnobacter litoralis]